MKYEANAREMEDILDAIESADDDKFVAYGETTSEKAEMQRLLDEGKAYHMDELYMAIELFGKVDYDKYQFFCNRLDVDSKERLAIVKKALQKGMAVNELEALLDEYEDTNQGNCNIKCNI